MQTEFIIHLVKQDNNGADLSATNERYLKIIAQAFGGFTATEARGGWISDEGKLFDEPVLRVTIASKNTPEQSGKLKQIALNYKVDASQLAVYIRGVDNTVIFV
jgi:hypothetical protein